MSRWFSSAAFLSKLFQCSTKHWNSWRCAYWSLDFARWGSRVHRDGYKTIFKRNLGLFVRDEESQQNDRGVARLRRKSFCASLTKYRTKRTNCSKNSFVTISVSNIQANSQTQDTKTQREKMFVV